ncbi:unnamed protein product [Larinioides sclopetarius]|uniref:Ribosomal protein L32 n=1 Tax=Larinioides sclopetarius TaxID=280406 RepID=A0AAV1ZQH8_9ARAC
MIFNTVLTKILQSKSKYYISNTINNGKTRKFYNSLPKYHYFRY